jgi:hypothetical protein
MNRGMLRLLTCLLLCTAIAIAQNKPQPDPDKARIVVSDIQNFWRAFDQSTEATRAEVMQREYLDRGTVGLKDFVRLRISSADNLANRINRAPRYYASIRDSTLRIETLEPRIRASFRALKEMYPKAVFRRSILSSKNSWRIVATRRNLGSLNHPRGDFGVFPVF